MKKVLAGAACLAGAALLWACTGKGGETKQPQGTDAPEQGAPEIEAMIDDGGAMIENTDDGGSHAYDGDALAYESIVLNISNAMMPVSDVFEIRKTENGVLVGHYSDRTRGWDEEDERTVIHEIDGDQALYEEIGRLSAACDITAWDGFAERDPDVLDGGGFTFEAVLSDGSTVKAHGDNAYPDGYGRFYDGLQNLFADMRIPAAEYRDKYFKVTVPEAWVNEAAADPGTDYTAFKLKGSGPDYLLFRADYDSYGYESSEETYRIGVLSKEGEEDRYLSFYRYTSYSLYQGNDYGLSEAQEAITENVWETALQIAETAEGINGWTLRREDGSILYEADADDAFAKAKTMWLNLRFAGEYPSGCTLAEIDGKKYRTFSASYEQPKINSAEKLKTAMRECFTEEFAEKTVEKLLKEKELVEKDGDLYTAYNMKEDPYLYNGGYVDSIGQKDEKTGSAVIKVQKAMPGDEKYVYSGEELITFPMERNEEGRWVFSDFPYWE